MWILSDGTKERRPTQVATGPRYDGSPREKAAACLPAASASRQCSGMLIFLSEERCQGFIPFRRGPTHPRSRLHSTAGYARCPCAPGIMGWREWHGVSASKKMSILGEFSASTAVPKLVSTNSAVASRVLGRIMDQTGPRHRVGTRARLSRFHAEVVVLLVALQLPGSIPNPLTPGGTCAICAIRT
jgi:hypothetical protein